MKITYENKVAIQNDEEILRKNKVTDLDMNEIKEVVNSNADEQTTIKSDITNIKQKDTEQDNKLSTLQTENIKLKEENKRLREDLKGLPNGTVSGENIDLKDSSEMRVLNFEIGGNSRQEKREGYNLIDLNNSNNRYLNKVNNGFKLSKANNRVSTISFNKPLSVGTYTLTLKKVNTTLTMEENAVRFSFKNALSEDISIYDLTNKNKITATINQECSSLYFYISANEVDTAEITFDDVQLVQGTEEKTFEPYGVSPSPDYPSEVQCCGDSGNINVEMCNKNLLNTEIIPVASAGIKTVEFSKDVLTVTSLAKSGYHYLLLNIGSVKKYDGKNLTISAKSIIETKEGYSRVCLCRYKSISPTTGTKNNVYITKNKLDNSLNINSTQESEYDEIGVLIYANANIGTESNTVKIEGLQVEEAIASSYTQHQSQTYTIPTQQPMRAIGEYKDTFIKKDGKWYERHFVKRYIVTGDETFYSAAPDRSVFSIRAINDRKAEKGFGVCNYFLYKQNAQIETIGTCFAFNMMAENKGVIYFQFEESVIPIADVNSCKTFFKELYEAEAPVYVDYVLETPIDIKCTAEQTEILEKIENEAKTYKNVTHIYSTDEINPNMKVTYFKDIETIIGG